MLLFDAISLCVRFCLSEFSLVYLKRKTKTAAGEKARMPRLTCKTGGEIGDSRSLTATVNRTYRLDTITQ